jgi:hypothetical protein
LSFALYVSSSVENILRQIRDRTLIYECHGRAVDDESGSIRCASGPRDIAFTNEIENLILIGLPRVLAGGDCRVGPYAELDVPERAVRVRVAWIVKRWEIALDVKLPYTSPDCSFNPDTVLWPSLHRARVQRDGPLLSLDNAFAI